MNHTLKLFLKIIHDRIYSKCEATISKNQFGFRNGFGTREALFSIQVLIQNCKDVQKDIFICFVDYEKAFDKVRHSKLIEILQKLDINQKDLRCIQKLYWEQKAVIRVGTELSEEIDITRGVRQGCILSPLLFNVYSEEIFQHLENINAGVKVNGVNINNIRYADDTALIADSLEGLELLLQKVNQYSQELGLSINIAKTKFMTVSRKNSLNTAQLKLGNETIERVQHYKYLGCWLNSEWDTSQEVKCRIECARNAFKKLGKVLTSRDFNIALKIRFIRCYVWSTLLYGSEIWTLKVRDMNRLEAFEMWIYRRILKISWVDHISNETVLQRLNKNREILGTIKRRKTAYFGHIMRNQKYEMLQLILQGKINGKRGIGRKQISWLRNIRHWTV